MNNTDNLILRGIKQEDVFINASSSTGSGSGSGIAFGPGTLCDKLLQSGEFSIMPEYEYMEINCAPETQLLHLKFWSVYWGGHEGRLIVTNYYNKRYEVPYPGSITIPIAANEPKKWYIPLDYKFSGINGYAATYQCKSGSGSGVNGIIIAN